MKYKKNIVVVLLVSIHCTMVAVPPKQDSNKKKYGKNEAVICNNFQLRAQQATGTLNIDKAFNTYIEEQIHGILRQKMAGRKKTFEQTLQQEMLHYWTALHNLPLEQAERTALFLQASNVRFDQLQETLNRETEHTYKKIKKELWSLSSYHNLPISQVLYLYKNDQLQKLIWHENQIHERKKATRIRAKKLASTSLLDVESPPQYPLLEYPKLSAKEENFLAFDFEPTDEEQRILDEIINPLNQFSS